MWPRLSERLRNAQGKLDREQSDVAKTADKIAKAQRDLEKIASDRAKLAL